MEPLAVAWHAVTRAPVPKDETALIVGAGPIGLAIVQVLKAQGVEKIIVVEVSEQRGQFARNFGATMVLNPTKVDAVSEARAFTGEITGAAVSFECSGIQAGLDTAVAAIRVRGTAVIVSIFTSPPALDAYALVHREKHVAGAAVYDTSDMEAVIAAISSGKFDIWMSFGLVE